jgi:hypothetical protein
MQVYEDLLHEPEVCGSGCQLLHRFCRVKLLVPEATGLVPAQLCIDLHPRLQIPAFQDLLSDKRQGCSLEVWRCRATQRLWIACKRMHKALLPRRMRYCNLQTFVKVVHFQQGRCLQDAWVLLSPGASAEYDAVASKASSKRSARTLAPAAVRTGKERRPARNQASRPAREPAVADRSAQCNTAHARPAAAVAAKPSAAPALDFSSRGSVQPTRRSSAGARQAAAALAHPQSDTAGKQRSSANAKQLRSSGAMHAKLSPVAPYKRVQASAALASAPPRTCEPVKSQQPGHVTKQSVPAVRQTAAKPSVHRAAAQAPTPSGADLSHVQPTYTQTTPAPSVVKAPAALSEQPDWLLDSPVHDSFGDCSARSHPVACPHDPCATVARLAAALLTSSPQADQDVQELASSVGAQAAAAAPPPRQHAEATTPSDMEEALASGLERSALLVSMGHELPATGARCMDRGLEDQYAVPASPSSSTAKAPGQQTSTGACQQPKATDQHRASPRPMSATVVRSDADRHQAAPRILRERMRESLMQVVAANPGSRTVASDVAAVGRPASGSDASKAVAKPAATRVSPAAGDQNVPMVRGSTAAAAATLGEQSATASISLRQPNVKSQLGLAPRQAEGSSAHAGTCKAVKAVTIAKPGRSMSGTRTQVVPAARPVAPGKRAALPMGKWIKRKKAAPQRLVEDAAFG